MVASATLTEIVFVLCQVHFNVSRMAKLNPMYTGVRPLDRPAERRASTLGSSIRRASSVPAVAPPALAEASGPARRDSKPSADLNPLFFASRPGSARLTPSLSSRLQLERSDWRGRSSANLFKDTQAPAADGTRRASVQLKPWNSPASPAAAAAIAENEVEFAQFREQAQKGWAATPGVVPSALPRKQSKRRSMSSLLGTNAPDRPKAAYEHATPQQSRGRSATAVVRPKK